MTSIRIHLNNPNNNNTFSPGEQISGNLKCFLNTKKTINAIKVILRGKGETKWEESKSYSDSNNQSIIYSAKEEYLNRELTLMNGRVDIPAGKHVYPFSFILPQSGLPQSYEGRYGHIRYFIKAIVERSWSNFVDKVPLTIFTSLDLNDLPYLRNCITTSVDNAMRYCCIYDPGVLTFNMSLPVTGFAPGQNVPVGAYLQNLTNVNVKSVRFKIIQDVQFFAHQPSSKTKCVENVIVGELENGVGAHGDKAWTTTLNIPNQDIYPHLESCTVMDISYRLKARVVVENPHKDMDNEVSLVIGNIPLTGVLIDFMVDPLPSEGTMKSKQ